MDEVENPLTESAASAAMMHEMYTTYRAAGFTMDEALKLIVLLLEQTAKETGES